MNRMKVAFTKTLGMRTFRDMRYPQKTYSKRLFVDKFPENLRSCGQRFFSGSEGPEKDF